jgi:hypothetical protein
MNRICVKQWSTRVEKSTPSRLTVRVATDSSKSLGLGPEGRTGARLASLARPLRRRSYSELVAFTSADSEAVKSGDLYSIDGRRLLFQER